MADLFPKGYEDECPYPGSNEHAAGPIGYRPGLAFDYIHGDFKRDGKEKVLESTGIESWKSWIVNCLQTERYAHLAYSPDFGIEYKKIFGAESRAESESILVRQITEAIMADPYGRASFVQMNAIKWLVDAVMVDFTVYGIDDVTIDIRTFLKQSEEV